MQKKTTKSNMLISKLIDQKKSGLSAYRKTSSKTIFIIKSTYHDNITSSITYDFINNLPESQKKLVCVIDVPGTFEIPYAIKIILEKLKKKISKKKIIFLAVGCVIKGETKHDEYISSTVINALRNLSLEYKVAIINGIITTLTYKQAIDRAGKKYRKGKDFASSLQMIIDLIKISDSIK